MAYTRDVEPSLMNDKKAANAGLSHAAAKVSDYFGCNVFGPETMRLLLPKEVYRKVQDAITHGKRFDLEVANTVASAMKTWAISKGATHYCHWFQPMTGATAEKHDSFMEPVGEGNVLEVFSGQQLVQAEPDASSFPSGGLRATFEARGYTAWDPTSPAFVLETPGGSTLCIPTIFVSYTGESLDTKTPLLRSIEALNKAALGILDYFDGGARKVFSTLGAEQEYFLIDAAYYRARPDLVLAERTLFGAASPKGQQLEDHYFGAIKDRVFSFMTDLESELYKLGVPLKTRHNEVAPNQFECAPVFEEANVAIDHNQLVMDMLRRVAARHKLSCLLYEKPFAGINGSGKHNNWSLGTDTGKNLLTPGDTPRQNLQFLLFLVSIIKAVRDHSLLLRASIASSGNDHRLGANEAPPAIMSVFLGAQLTGVLGDIEKGVTGKSTPPAWMDFGIDKIPAILKDNTDRNRTSPFAFTGNKFEFRAVGSSFNNAGPITVLNTIVANQLLETKKEIDALLKTKKDFKAAAIAVVRKLYKEGKAVCFEGNNYSAEWAAEAKRRGLPNVKTTPDALLAFKEKAAVAMFERLGVLSRQESLSRYHIKLEKYAKDIDIEAKTILEMVDTLYVPAAVEYMGQLSAAIEAAGRLLGKEACLRSPQELLRELALRLSEARTSAAELAKALAAAEAVEDAEAKAAAYCRKVKPLFTPARAAVDALEGLVPAKLWPVPKYREMLFLL
ncbi:MAG: glutamine synthetase III [Elusimicrobia bacterium]|nr:glutamine synthetase III [Elusimicrobiota bacterium]MDE2236693.1 glutamine synthetase III [Elusimicrobiota bacterium]MDE2425123.1 glutamine synthetase III [Elusimicrobiota bacterium]